MNLGHIIGISSILWLLIGWGVKSLAPRPYDDTDNGNQRSGLEVRTDHLTGCQYLVADRGGLTPRMAADGKKHIGCLNG